MGRSVVRVSSRVDRDRLERLGFHEMDEIRGGYEEDPFTCPFGLESYCEGYKDPEHKERCEVDHPIKLLNCELYINFVTKPETFLYPLQTPNVDPNADTVIMHEDEIVSRSSYDDSVHDQIADGKDVRQFFKMRNALRTGSVDYRVD